MRLKMGWKLLLLLLFCCASLRAQLNPNPDPPDGVGVNIHFVEPRPGEPQMIAAAGMRWVRTDFRWENTEQAKGQYNFANYDHLVAALDRNHLRAILVLDYVNRFYDQGQSPYSPEGQAAFTRWAVAAAQHFRGHGIVWEMYNEPNGFFWRPKKPSNAQDYIRLALSVGQAFQKEAPGELLMGPATSGIDFGFLEACFRAGLLKYWAGVSVHPYRPSNPETVNADYARLRQMISQYAGGKQIPIICGEWGYPFRGPMNDELQAKYLARMWLNNLASGIPISVWYDWVDPSIAEDAKSIVVKGTYNPSHNPVFNIKPAYLAARTFTQALNGLPFAKRISAGSAEDYILQFGEGSNSRLAAWTTGSPHPVTIPVGPGSFADTDFTGQALPALRSAGRGLNVRLTDAPQYLSPE